MLSLLVPVSEFPGHQLLWIEESKESRQVTPPPASRLGPQLFSCFCVPILTRQIISQDAPTQRFSNFSCTGITREFVLKWIAGSQSQNF